MDIERVTSASAPLSSGFGIVLSCLIQDGAFGLLFACEKKMSAMRIWFAA